MRLVSLTLAALVTAAVPSYSASAQVSAADPDSIVKILQKEGYRASLSTDKEGDPKIETAMSGWNVGIIFYGCTANKDCQSIQFNTGFDRTTPMSIEKLNRWLDEHRFGKVFFDDEGDPILVWDVILGEGVPDSVFIKSIHAFEDIAGTFGQFVFDDSQSGLDEEDGDKKKPAES